MYAYYTYCTLYYSSPFQYFPLPIDCNALSIYNLSLRTSLRFSEYPRFADFPMHFVITARLQIEVRIRSAHSRAPRTLVASHIHRALLFAVPHLPRLDYSKSSIIFMYYVAYYFNNIFNDSNYPVLSLFTFNFGGGI